jgi:TatD DNase family protein
VIKTAGRGDDIAILYLQPVIDSHCHLDISAFDLDRADVIARAQQNGVLGMLVPAIRPKTWPALNAMAVEFGSRGIRVALGIHPQIVPELSEHEVKQGQCDALVAAISAISSQTVLAVGECGLDGGTANMDLQLEVFRQQIRAARILRMPLVVHVLRAHHLAPAILKQERAQEIGGIMHSYSGGTDLIRVYQDLGFAFSFAGPVTYPGSRRPLAAAKAVPDSLLLVETDAPDQLPVPLESSIPRGTRCEPSHIIHVVEAIARARNCSLADLAALTTANTRRILRWIDP